jgi:uncharacterized protein
MNGQDWEDICKKCGTCCYEKVDLGGGIIRYTDEPCEHLDTETKLCKVYGDRHEKVPDCISLTEDIVRVLHWLPPDCAYVEHIRFKDTLAAVKNIDNKQKKRSKRRK